MGFSSTAVPVLLLAGVTLGGCTEPPPSVGATEFQQRKDGYATLLEAQAVDEAGGLESEVQSLYESADAADGTAAEHYRERAEAREAAAADVLEDGFSQADEQRAMAIKSRQQDGR